MSILALALAPVLPASTGTGANTGPALPKSHRHHAVRENTDGNKESGEPGRFAGRPCPGASLFPSSSIASLFASSRPGAVHEQPGTGSPPGSD
jgi:hypothetical protein